MNLNSPEAQTHAVATTSYSILDRSPHPPMHVAYQQPRCKQKDEVTPKIAQSGARYGLLLLKDDYALDPPNFSQSQSLQHHHASKSQVVPKRSQHRSEFQ